MSEETKININELAGFQRKYLRGLAHGFKPIVQVGKGGITDSVILAIEQGLWDHELIKVRLIRPEDKKGAAKELAERSRAELCGLVGHMVVLYRSNPEKPVIKLPKRKSPPSP
jgi:RNA-binding protein